MKEPQKQKSVSDNSADGNRSHIKELWLFFLIAIVWSWAFWLPEIFWGYRLYLGPFGPFVAAVILTLVNEKSSGLLELLKRGIKVRFGAIWYIPVLLLMPAISLVSYMMATSVEGVSPDLSVLSQPWLILSTFIYIFFLGGPLQEEFGWRGYALPRLQSRFSALKASVFLGTVWALWHLPLNFMFDQAGLQYEATLMMITGSFFLMIFLSVIFTWIYNNTGGSIFAVLVLHTMTNLFTYVVFPVFETQIGPLFFSMLVLLTAVLLLIVFGPKKLMRSGSTAIPESQ